MNIDITTIFLSILICAIAIITIRSAIRYFNMNEKERAEFRKNNPPHKDLSEHRDSNNGDD